MCLFCGKILNAVFEANAKWTYSFDSLVSCHGFQFVTIIVIYFVFLRDRKLAVVLTQESVRMAGVPALGWILFSPRAGQASQPVNFGVTKAEGRPKP